MGEFGFVWPWVLGLLALVPLCVRLCAPRYERLYFPGAEHFVRAARRSRWRRWAVWAVFGLMVVALADPVLKKQVEIQNDKGYEISLILDASGSMAQSGKFDIVKDIVKRFVSRRTHDRIGLTIFADFAYVAVPLTYDKASLLRLLDRIEVGVAGTRRTALYEALFLSTRLFRDAKSKQKIAILLTDGMDNTGTVPMEVAIKTAKKYGIRVYTIGVGGRGDYNPWVLEKIAKETGGKFFEADSVRRLEEVYRTIDRLEKSEIEGLRFVRMTHYFAWPLGAALALALLLLLPARGRGGAA